MSDHIGLAAKWVVDGEDWHRDAALLVKDGVSEGIVPIAAARQSGTVQDFGDVVLAPGFVDLQVNGGGGVMLNDHPSVEGIETICRSHAPFGTTALLPTLITDTPEVTARAIEAGIEAGRRKVPGFIGLHLEGPHLSIARKGAHDPRLIRPMTDADLAMLIEARRSLPTLLVTIAPESVTPGQVAALTEAGIVVSLGHTDASYETAGIYAKAGASMVTHLFNAMSQIGNREPGLVGAAIDKGELSAGLIADGIHVNVSTIEIAMRAKLGPGRIFLVTDAMATIGTDLKSFELNGRTIYRKDGSLRLEDGTLAGADLDMISAVKFACGLRGLGLPEALPMASSYPAAAIRRQDRLGHLKKGAAANIVALTPALDIEKVWIDGRRVFAA